MIIQNNNFDIIIFELNTCCTAFNYPRKKIGILCTGIYFVHTLKKTSQVWV